MEHFVNQINAAEPVSVSELRSLQGQALEDALGVYSIHSFDCRLSKEYNSHATSMKTVIT